MLSTGRILFSILKKTNNNDYLAHGQIGFDISRFGGKGTPNIGGYLVALCGIVDAAGFRVTLLSHPAVPRMFLLFRLTVSMLHLFSSVRCPACTNTAKGATQTKLY